MQNHIIIKTFLSITLLLCTLKAQEYPSVYSQLGTPLFKQSKTVSLLGQNALFSKEVDLFEQYEKMSKTLLEEGLRLDMHSPKAEIKEYLKKLRKLQKRYEKIEKSYKQKLYKSIYDENINAFYALIQTPLPFISTDARLKEKVVRFYKDNPKKSVTFLKYLSQDLELDEKSYAYLDQMFQLYEAKKKVEARKFLEDFEPIANTSRPVQIVSVERKDGFDLYIENHSVSDVTVKVEAKVLENLSSSKKLPYIDSFPAQSRNHVLSFSIIDKKYKSAFQTYYSSMKGRLIDDYDKEYLYALPFHRGTSYQLTQGFHGKYTHNGKSEYALDFKMDIGTPVHAMRDGIVIATQSQYSEHGFSPEFASKSNYIIIEHDDGTMAMYGHLDKGGVRVRVGDEVKKHQRIGSSGNTGYSSGPHLHVHISALKSFEKGPASVPFHFASKAGAVSVPIAKSFYTAR